MKYFASFTYNVNHERPDINHFANGNFNADGDLMKVKNVLEKQAKQEIKEQGIDILAVTLLYFKRLV